MIFFKNHKMRKEIKRDCENYFRNMVIKNLSDFNRYSNFSNNNKIVNILEGIFFFMLGVLAGSLIAAYIVLT